MRVFTILILTLCISVSHANAADLNRLKDADNGSFKAQTTAPCFTHSRNRRTWRTASGIRW